MSRTLLATESTEKASLKNACPWRAAKGLFKSETRNATRSAGRRVDGHRGRHILFEDEIQEAKNRNKSRVRARVAHVFGVIKSSGTLSRGRFVSNYIPLQRACHRQRRAVGRATRSDG